MYEPFLNSLLCIRVFSDFLSNDHYRRRRVFRDKFCQNVIQFFLLKTKNSMFDQFQKILNNSELTLNLTYLTTG